MIDETPTAYPLCWPEDWERTRHKDRKSRQYHETIRTARRGMAHAMSRLGATDVLISSNQPLTNAGVPRSIALRLDDPGVAVYCMFGHERCVIACDQYLTMLQNLCAVWQALDAFGVGGNQIAAHAFRRLAVHPQCGADVPPVRPWRDVLAYPDDGNVTIEGIGMAFRAALARAHPDEGGSDAAFLEVQDARRRALAELTRSGR